MHVTEREALALWLSAYALCYFALLFQPGLVRMDDFAYLRSVAETVAAGRPHTDAVLEPYAAFTSVLGALAYMATGEFPLATWGMQSVFVLLNAFLLWRWLRNRLPAGTAFILASALLAIPVYAHKCSEFTGNVPALSCVLAALLAYDKRRWGVFFLAAFLAFANRQNAAALLALPAWEAWRDPRERRPILLGSAAYFCAAAGLHLAMNRTAAQALGIYAGFPSGGWIALLRNQALGGCAGLAFLSAFAWLTGDSPVRNFRGNIARPIAPIAATGVFALAAFSGSLPLFSFLTPLIGSLDRGFALQYALLAGIPIALWTLDWRRLRPDAMLALFLAFAVLSGMKGYWYDFYLSDVALGALCLCLGPIDRVTSAGPLPLRAAGTGAFARTLAWALIAGGLAWGYAYKVLCDKQLLSVVLYESLERSGRIAPPRMTDATFGYLGWKLVGPFLALGGKYPDLAGFQGFVERDQIIMETETPWRRRFRLGTAAAKAETVEAGTARIGFVVLRYRMLDLHGNPPVSLGGSAPLAFDRDRFPADPYPLDAQEWDLYIRRIRSDHSF
jgi:hypothetical protein